MPNNKNLEEVLATSSITFQIKTGGGKWKAQLHSNRAAYERTKTTKETTEEPETVPGIVRKDSGLSSSSTASSSSSSSH
ncbi:hypothetical protein GGS21DRAFT_492727 [Xylaria nigripes]|nr:hypothetical protein GGS21DRAFT_492727 [Xylaria nigripes]